MGWNTVVTAFLAGLGFGVGVMGGVSFVLTLGKWLSLWL
jgi:hypothetical protein